MSPTVYYSQDESYCMRQLKQKVRFNSERNIYWRYNCFSTACRCSVNNSHNFIFIFKVSPRCQQFNQLVAFSGAFGPGLITCSQQITPLTPVSDSNSYSRVADMEFINKYCFGNMIDYNYHPNGDVDPNSGNSLSHIKLFPYVLFGLAVIGLASPNIGTVPV